jgi:Na+/H+-dicarboxylate symporter
MITSNIFMSFNEANFVAVIFFAIMFGLALSRVLDKSSRSLADAITKSTVMLFLKETEAVLLVLINWVIMATPCTLIWACFALCASCAILLC